MTRREIANRLVNARPRLREDKSVGAVARTIGLTPQAYTQIELGVRSVKAEELALLCDRLKVSIKWVLGLVQ